MILARARGDANRPVDCFDTGGPGIRAEPISFLAIVPLLFQSYSNSNSYSIFDR